MSWKRCPLQATPAAHAVDRHDLNCCRIASPYSGVRRITHAATRFGVERDTFLKPSGAAYVTARVLLARARARVRALSARAQTRQPRMHFFAESVQSPTARQLHSPPPRCRCDCTSLYSSSVGATAPPFAPLPPPWLLGESGRGGATAQHLICSFRGPPSSRARTPLLPFPAFSGASPSNSSYRIAFCRFCTIYKRHRRGRPPVRRVSSCDEIYIYIQASIPRTQSNPRR